VNYQPITTKTHAAIENIQQNLPVFGEKSANIAKFPTDTVKSRRRQSFLFNFPGNKIHRAPMNFGGHGETFFRRQLAAQGGVPFVTQTCVR